MFRFECATAEQCTDLGPTQRGMKSLKVEPDSLLISEDTRLSLALECSSDGSLLLILLKIISRSHVGGKRVRTSPISVVEARRNTKSLESGETSLMVSLWPLQVISMYVFTICSFYQSNLLEIKKILWILVAELTSFSLSLQFSSWFFFLSHRKQTSALDQGGHRDQEEGSADHQQGRGSVHALAHWEQHSGGAEQTAGGLSHLSHLSWD